MHEEKIELAREMLIGASCLVGIARQLMAREPGEPEIHQLLSGLGAVIDDAILSDEPSVTPARFQGALGRSSAALKRARAHSRQMVAGAGQ